MNAYHEKLVQKILAKRKAIAEKKARSGVVENTPKGIQYYYSTRQLIDMIEKRFQTTDSIHINSKHQLQIRGKHLRRLKKKLAIEQIGRCLRKK